MEIDFLCVDNFYDDPDAIRSLALKQEYAAHETVGSHDYDYPGYRSAQYLPNFVRRNFDSIMAGIGQIDWGFSENSDCGRFQYATSNDRTWIHADDYEWAGVCYLTPNAPHTGGTGFFRHKYTNEWKTLGSNHEGYDYTKWDLVDRIANKYNRLILYKGRLFHASLDYFGSNIQDGRLFQVFFFNTYKGVNK
jgi:hypothetical protein